MILLAVLRQYVKVLLGKHRLELHDVSRQWSGSGMHLFTAPGSFYETLEGCSHSSEVSLSELWENICKEQSVSRLPIRVVCWQRCVFKL